jgi:hypothetical protein
VDGEQFVNGGDVKALLQTVFKKKEWFHEKARLFTPSFIIFQRVALLHSINTNASDFN